MLNTLHYLLKHQLYKQENAEYRKYQANIKQEPPVEDPEWVKKLFEPEEDNK